MGQKYVKKGTWKWENEFTLCLFGVCQVAPLYTTAVVTWYLNNICSLIYVLFGAKE